MKKSLTQALKLGPKLRVSRQESMKEWFMESNALRKSKATSKADFLDFPASSIMLKTLVTLLMFFTFE